MQNGTYLRGGLGLHKYACVKYRPWFHLCLVRVGGKPDKNTLLKSDHVMSLKTTSFFLPSLSPSRSVDCQAFYHACPPTPQSLHRKTPAPHTPPSGTKSKPFQLPFPPLSIDPLSLSSTPPPCLILAFFIPFHPLRLHQDYEKNSSRLCPFPGVSLANSGHMLPAAFSNWSRGDLGRGLRLSLPLRVPKPFRVAQHTLCRQRPTVCPPSC